MNRKGLHKRKATYFSLMNYLSQGLYPGALTALKEAVSNLIYHGRLMCMGGLHVSAEKPWRKSGWSVGWGSRRCQAGTGKRRGKKTWIGL